MISIMLIDYSLSFWQGARFVISGEMKVGQILTVVLALMMGSGALGQAAPHFQAFAVAIATSGPIFSVIDHEVFNESTEGKVPTALQGSIELRSVRHIYPSRPEVVVLQAMDLIIPAGKVTALVGASGSGKSTIVGLLERFYTPVGGQILLDGEDIQNLDLKWLRRQIALVSQEPVLFGTSVYGNIAHGLIGTELENAPDERKMEMVISAAKMANAHEFISLLPGGYNMNVGERGFLL
jgi:ATP-binding cassette subfamily B (MDR/TAP) protein 1